MTRQRIFLLLLPPPTTWDIPLRYLSSVLILQSDMLAPPSETQVTSEIPEWVSPDKPACPGAHPTGAFFPNAQHFVIAGGSFTSVTNIGRVETPTDFRMLRLGDLDLRNEIRLDTQSGRVHCQNRRGSMRRIYSVRVHGCKSTMTVAVYQGKNAEEEWWRNVSRHSQLRHPNVVQVFGIVSSRGLHAVIWNDELIPVNQMFKKYSSNPAFSGAHFWACLEQEFTDGNEYIQSVAGRDLFSEWLQYTTWIRPRTRRLCVELTPDRSDCHTTFFLPPTFGCTLSLLKPVKDSEMAAWMSLENYHCICVTRLSQTQYLSISGNDCVKMGAIYHCTPGTQFKDANEIAFIPYSAFDDHGWCLPTYSNYHVMENGWTRVESSYVMGESISYTILPPDRDWLSQAHHIFNSHKITSNYEDYISCTPEYTLYIEACGDSIPSGYLFLCPLADLQSMPNVFRMPDVPAYWSLSPEGVEPLSTEEAERLGFPPIKCELQNRTHRWDRAVYDGLRTFHQGKGFDPYSQDVALVLGYRLFQVVGEVNDLQTHGKESDGFPGDVSTHGRNEGAIAEEPCDVRQKDTVVEETRMPGDLDPVKNARPSRGWTMVFWIYSAFILVFRQLRDFLIMGG